MSKAKSSIAKTLKEGGFTDKQIKSLEKILPKAMEIANDSDFDAATKKDLKVLKLELNADVEKVKSELQKEIQQNKNDLQKEIEQNKNDLQVYIEKTKGELSEKIHRSTLTTIVVITAILGLQLAVLKFF